MNPLIILGIIVGVAALIAIIAFSIHKTMSLKIKDDNSKPTEEEVREEEISRVLQQVDDEEVAKQIQDYKQNDDE